MTFGVLGKEYADGQQLCCQGEAGDCMFVIQAGCAEVLREDNGSQVVVGTLSAGDVFGEMAIFDRQPRSATVRAAGNARVMTLDKRAFLRRVHEDPSFAFEIMKKMSLRIRSLNEELQRARKG